MNTKLNSATSLSRNTNLTRPLTVLGAILGLVIGVVLVSTASAQLQFNEELDTSVTKTQPVLPEEWVWKKKTISFDHMYGRAE